MAVSVRGSSIGLGVADPKLLHTSRRKQACHWTVDSCAAYYYRVLGSRAESQMVQVMQGDVVLAPSTRHPAQPRQFLGLIGWYWPVKRREVFVSKVAVLCAVLLASTPSLLATVSPLGFSIH
jgi:hypothetical protein